MITLHPLTQRRIDQFFHNRLAASSLKMFSILVTILLLCNCIANERPLIVRYQNHWYFPVLFTYSGQDFGGTFATEANYQDPVVIKNIEKKGWLLMPPIPFSYDTHDFRSNIPQPAPPSWRHWLGTDDQGRDITARILYGARISILFGFCLTGLSLVVGVTIGALQGFYGGMVDLIGQRFIEIWSGMPTLYLLIILSSLIKPSFFWLMVVMLLFGWVKFVGVVRAEFLRARNLDYVNAAKTLGVSNRVIIFRHILPNALVATITYLPWNIIGAIMSLSALDFLGFGMPIGSPSMGELVAQAKNNIHAPWIGLSVFVMMFSLLSLLIFIGEGMRDAIDPQRNQP